MSVKMSRQMDSNDCISGYNWYVCVANGYHGCCKIDPCDGSYPDGCPAIYKQPEDGGISASTTASTTAQKTVTSMSPTKSASQENPDDNQTTNTANTIDSSSASHTATVDPSTPGSAVTVTVTPSQQHAAAGSGLSTGEIAGIGVGAGIVVVVFLVVVVLCVHRRRKAKRVPQVIVTNDDRLEEKYAIESNIISSSGTASHADPFASFGGRSDEQNISTRKNNESLPGALSYASDSITYVGSPTSGYSSVAHHSPGGPAQLDSKPVSRPFELDSTPLTSPQYTSTSADQRVSAISQGSSSMLGLHPSPLTPGFPMEQAATQDAMLETGTAAGSGGVLNDQDDRAGCGVPIARATLNSTPEDRRDRRDVTSWTRL